MIRLWLGLGGDGKSADMTWTAFKTKSVWSLVNDNYTVYANYPLLPPFGDFVYLEDNRSYIDQIDRSSPGLVLLDELQEVAEPRQFKSKENINVAHLISQIRKLHKDVYGTAQLGSEVEKRIRLKANYIVECQAFPPQPSIPSPFYRPQFFMYNVLRVDRRTGNFDKVVNRYKITDAFADRFIYPMYDSYAVISPYMKVSSPAQKVSA